MFFPLMDIEMWIHPHKLQDTHIVSKPMPCNKKT